MKKEYVAAPPQVKRERDDADNADSFVEELRAVKQRNEQRLVDAQAEVDKMFVVPAFVHVPNPPWIPSTIALIESGIKTSVARISDPLPTFSTHLRTCGNAFYTPFGSSGNLLANSPMAKAWTEWHDRFKKHSVWRHHASTERRNDFIRCIYDTMIDRLVHAWGEKHPSIPCTQLHECKCKHGCISELRFSLKDI